MLEWPSLSSAVSWTARVVSGLRQRDLGNSQFVLVTESRRCTPSWSFFSVWARQLSFWKCRHVRSVEIGRRNSPNDLLDLRGISTDLSIPKAMILYCSFYRHGGRHIDRARESRNPWQFSFSFILIIEWLKSISATLLVRFEVWALSFEVMFEGSKKWVPFVFLYKIDSGCKFYNQNL